MLALVATGCARRSEIVVVVATDLAVPMQIDRVHFVARVGERELESLGMLPTTNGPALTLGLSTDGDSDAELTLTAEGLLGDATTPVVVRTVQTHFVPGKRVALRVVLPSCCAGSAARCAAGQTCGDTGACESAVVAPESLAPWQGNASALSDAAGICGAGEAWPGPANTGVPAGTVLTPSDAREISTAGTVLDGVTVQGCLHVTAPNVTIRRSRIVCQSYIGINGDETATGLRIEDVEIEIRNPDEGTYGVDCEACTVLRTYVHGSVYGAIVGTNGLVADSWILGTSGTFVGHDIALRHNTIACPTAKDCVFVGTVYGAVDNVMIERNRIDGGRYAVWVGDPMNGLPTRVTVRSNRFGRGSRDGILGGTAAPTWSDNVWDDDGQPVLP